MEYFGEVRHVDLGLAAEDDGALDGVFQFADVAGPIVALEGGHGGFGEAYDFAAAVFAELAEEISGEQGDVA